MLTGHCDWQALFRRAQLKALVDIHSTSEGMGGYLTNEEIGIIRGALDLSGKRAVMAMTPLDKVGPRARPRCDCLVADGRRPACRAH